MMLQPFTPRRRKALGFTLVEVLVALAIMGIITGLAWQGISAMSQSMKSSQEHSRELAVMQTTLAQWGQDLNQLLLLPGQQYSQKVPPLHYDAERQVLIMLRQDLSRNDRALHVVAWAKRPDDGELDSPKGRPGQWLRWQSPVLLTQEELEDAWDKAQRWSQDSEAESLRSFELAIMPIQDWELRGFDGKDWSEGAQSIEVQGRRPLRLHGLRLVITPAEGGLFHGPITRDWINPVAPGV